MEKTLVIALINSLIEKKFNAIDLDSFRGSRGPRGLKGLKGEPGKDFCFEENKQEINALIDFHINQIKQDLKLSYDDLTLEQKQELKFKYTDFTEEELSGLRGPRGQRGKPGKSIDWDSVKGEAYKQLEEIYSKNKTELKLKFSDLTKEEKDSLRLKFDQLSEIEKLELKGEKGERGVRGSRGQRGKEGPQGEKGEKGDKGERGERGLPGITGLTGPKGRDGIDGKDGLPGKDAPKVIQVKIKKVRNKIKIVFIYNDGSEHETNFISLPDPYTIIQQSTIAASGGGGGSQLEFFSNGVSIGSFEKVDFLNGSVEVDPLDSTKLNVDLNSACLPILDEGVEVTSCVKEINFIGAGVTVLPQQVISSWLNLSSVDSMATFGGDPNKVDVLIDNVADSVASINDNTFTEIRNITSSEIINTELTLTTTPSDPSKVFFEIISGPSQVPGVDFQVVGNKLNWSTLGLQTIIEENDLVRINYVI